MRPLVSFTEEQAQIGHMHMHSSPVHWLPKKCKLKLCCTPQTGTNEKHQMQSGETVLSGGSVKCHLATLIKI